MASKVLHLREKTSGFSDWVIGTRPRVIDSSFISEQIQVFYANAPGQSLLVDEKYHRHHPSLTEEYYLVLQGSLCVKVEGIEIHLGPMDMLPVRPEQCHSIINFSDDVQYLTIRAPISNKKSLCRESP